MEDQVCNDLQQNPEVKRDLRLLEYVAEHRGNLTLTSYYEYAYLLLLIGEKVTAENILSQLSESEESVETMEIRYRIAEYEENDEEALTLLKSLLSYQMMW